MLREESDKELREMAQEEIKELTLKLEDLERELTILLLPKDPNDDKDVFIEIRAGAGGDEAALFASNLLRMYTRYAERKNWKVETMSLNATDIGGFKEVTVAVKGKGAYSRLKYESGVHRFKGFQIQNQVVEFILLQLL